MKRKIILTCIILGVIGIIYVVSQKPVTHNSSQPNTRIISGSFNKNKMKSDEEWRKILTPQQYYILRQQGT